MKPEFWRISLRLTQLAVVAVVLAGLGTDAAFASACPGKDFKTFFDALLDKPELQREFAYQPILFIPYSGPPNAWGEFLPFDEFKVQGQDRLFPDKNLKGFKYHIKSYSKYVDVDIIYPFGSMNHFEFTYKSNNYCWSLFTIREIAE